MKEIVLNLKKNGMFYLILWIFLYILAVAASIIGGLLLENGEMIGTVLLILGIIWCVVGIIPFMGLKVLKPNEALVLTLFGKYKGSIKEDGFYFVNPFCTSVNPAAKTKLLSMGVSCFAENFFKCVEDGNSCETTLFLQAGFDVNMRDMRGNSVLTLAVRGGSLEVVEILLKAGADINAVSGDRGYSPLMDAVHTKRPDIAEFLLENGADPNVKGMDSQTAVCIAAGRGDVGTCRLLMKYNADPSIPDALGMSAAGYAKLFHNDELCRLFNV